MSEITVKWRRTISTAPYESAVLELGITETVNLQPIPAIPAEVAKRAEQLAALQKEIFVKLVAVGNALVADHLSPSRSTPITHRPIPPPTVR